ncbi:MAG: HNH endonuclease [Candidatus Nitrosocosmicus sp.]
MTEERKVIKRFKSFILGKCRCGCNFDIKIANYDYLIKYYKGHGRWPYKNKNYNEIIKCSCSVECNKNIKRWDKRGKERKYAKGHSYVKRNPYHDRRGYNRIYKPNHPNSFKRGFIAEHRFIMSEFLNRPLTKNEVVHHKNGIKDDNRIENLELFQSNSKHISENHKINMDDRFCFECNITKSFDKYYNHWYNHPLIKNKWLCLNCYQKIYRKIKKYKENYRFCFLLDFNPVFTPLFSRHF